MKRALITGGLGFIGSHLADRLLEEGFQVTIVDSLLSNTMQPEAYSGRCHLILEPIGAVAHGLKEHYDEIYHLASVVGPAAVLNHAGTMARSVIQSCEACIDLALRNEAPLIVASTSEVYGRAGVMAVADHCVVPSDYTVRLEYAVAKLTTEIASINRARVSNLRVNVIRPFNVTGPRQLPNGGFVLPRFIVAALGGRPLTVFGNGQQVRAFTDVRDIVTGLIKITRSEHYSRVFNLGTPCNKISMYELASRVKLAAGSESPLALVDPKELFGPMYAEGCERVPQVDATAQALGWVPSISIDQTIADTLAWYRDRPELFKQELVGARA